ncbi:helix-turn-helix domain-containing protein [Streptomyces gilvosporeus]|uniref:Transcriptional regulator n=1 Tax=Streptomyces gilvosporeus TaxID=553510 RepID=A0A1V0TPX8_9ACTN|nr:helix-turn-helix transcriptional regulator [Streptomyces gilvosporeus]ARF55007.1 transcriptional regulator [Streptomyces gilvosporeus]
MTADHERSDSLRTFGAVYQGFRESRGFTQESLAPEIRYSQDYIASVEQGRILPSKTFLQRSEDVLDALGVLEKAAKRLSKRRGLASWFRAWAGMEEKATTLHTYECRLIPGLLQTERYARLLFESRVPLLTDAEVDTRLAVRLERQQLLRDRPKCAFSFILEEHLFLRHVGGVEATRELIDHMLGLATLRNIEIQVLPLSQGMHAGMDGPMQLVETPDHEWYGYCEGQENGTLISDPTVISMLHARYAKLRSEALSLDDSVGLLKRLRGAL